ncbi:MAG: TIGR00730 family Rossman fold protein [Tannerella sp.]|nr:TIGR00730 family Rossman fold protein [Tannerella sp.]
MKEERQGIDRVRTVCVYCGSSAGNDPSYGAAAERLGRLLGEQGLRVINGAGASGLMRVLSDAVLKAGGTVTGIIPRFMLEKGWCHSGLTEVIRTETMHERKKQMAALSDAVVALPGSYGTMEELMEIITWRQLELYRGEVIVLNINRYYDPLLAMLRRAKEEGFLHDCHVAIAQIVQTPEEAVALILRQSFNRHSSVKD